MTLDFTVLTAFTSRFKFLKGYIRVIEFLLSRSPSTSMTMFEIDPTQNISPDDRLENPDMVETFAILDDFLSHTQYAFAATNFLDSGLDNPYPIPESLLSTSMMPSYLTVGSLSGKY